MFTKPILWITLCGGFFSRSAWWSLYNTGSTSSMQAYTLKEVWPRLRVPTTKPVARQQHVKYIRSGTPDTTQLLESSGKSRCSFVNISLRSPDGRYEFDSTASGSTYHTPISQPHGSYDTWAVTYHSPQRPAVLQLEHWRRISPSRIWSYLFS